MISSLLGFSRATRSSTIPMSPEVFDAVDAVYDAVAANDFSHFVRLGQEQ